MTESWFSDYGVFRKLGNGRFICVSAEDDLKKMLEKKFDLLEQVRSYSYGDKVVGLTLSIGVGRGEKTGEAESSAIQALDMALGRGGDQVAVRNTDETYTFFGGVSGGVEKRTRVRSRVMASALAELIRNAGNVLVMGHKFSDLDALGSAVGVLKICQDLGTDARIVVSKKTSLALPLIEHLTENNMDGYLISPDYAEQLIDGKTLLIIVDTLRADFVDSPAVYEKAKQVVVIDHHRKTVDYIQNAVLFYHEPRASSASEMVAELMQYTSKVKPTPVVANALLAGITLDTKNFVLRTSTRTFEAAAYLRTNGADTVTVKQFFNNTLENQKLRGKIVLSAYEHSNCAIAVADIQSKDIRLISAQAADELLTINNVDASFVLFMTEDTVNISARSLGNINVQVIMEQFGGGGHQTMAACQVENSDIDTVRNILEEKIDEYLSEK
jgi:c-di-AMP phosphodiesterase-like protein